MLLAFEGPDGYSMVGGLGTRVTELSVALADAGVETTLLFIGDPSLSPIERLSDKLEYRRCCQSISAKHPDGVYAGERKKVEAYAAAVPRPVTEIVESSVRRDHRALIIAEDWQCVPAVIAVDRHLRGAGLRERVTLVWNANSTYGFSRIKWSSLVRAVTTVATVSRYMKLELSARGVESLVIPNGIPARSVAGPSRSLAEAVRGALVRRPLYVKVGRFEEEKGWLQAIDAFAAIRTQRDDAMFIVRGGHGGFAPTFFQRAAALGLGVECIENLAPDSADVLDAIAAVRAPIADVRIFVPEQLLTALYCVADAVLANSFREPFGLVGLEVMAAGGVAVTGSTGEEYAQPFENALVCDTRDPRELRALLEAALNDPELAASIRRAATVTAQRYTWPAVIELLARKLDALGR